MNELTLALDLVYLLFVTAMLWVFLARRAAWHRVWKRAACISAVLLFFVACFFSVKLYETLAVSCPQYQSQAMEDPINPTHDFFLDLDLQEYDGKWV